MTARPDTLAPDRLAELVARVPAGGGQTWPVTEVYTGETLVDLPQSGAVDVERAFVRARQAQPDWAALSVQQRLRVFSRVHSLVLDRADWIADLIQAETGKARRMAVEELCDVAMVTSHYLRRAPALLRPVRRGGPVPLLSTSTEIRQPKGVVAVIAPWNFPFSLGLADAVPALMAGNAVVLKPDNRTALSPLAGVRLLEEAGLPPGLFQVVCGEGADIGPELIDRANYVMFTGSVETGRQVGERAARNLIGCCLELGGKNPMVVLEDADLDEAVASAVFGAFANAGQLCMHIERIYLPQSRYAEFRDRFVAATEALTIGAAYDFTPELGSLISTEHLDRVHAHVTDARSRGALVLTGGRPLPELGPAFYAPTVLEGVTRDMLAGTGETFGPVVSLYPYRTPDEAVALANDTDYGLNAAVFGSDVRAAERVARRLHAGNVNVNDTIATAYAAKGTPSGGVKQSGLGTRHGDQGLLKYTDAQNVGVLKKQVLGPRPGQAYADYARQTLQSLKLMKRAGIR